jgi:predicted enzyme related to lactoylglutathione lyase
MLSQPIDAGRTAVAARERGVGGDGSTWTVTGRAPVEPGYLAMRSSDLDRTRAFYGALFGWQIEAGNVPGGGHVENTTLPMGFAPPAAPPADGGPVTVYFRVDDIERYAARVVELGGTVLSRATYASGGNATCADDQGFRFDLFQPGPGY